MGAAMGGVAAWLGTEPWLPSLDAIEKTYDALNESQVFKDLHNIVDVNRREIIRLIG